MPLLQNFTIFSCILTYCYHYHGQAKLSGRLLVKRDSSQISCPILRNYGCLRGQMWDCFSLKMVISSKGTIFCVLLRAHESGTHVDSCFYRWDKTWWESGQCTSQEREKTVSDNECSLSYSILERQQFCNN